MAAKDQFDLVLSGQALGVNTAGRKGKYSMEVRGLHISFILSSFNCVIKSQQALHMRTHAAIDALGCHRPL